MLFIGELAALASAVLWSFNSVSLHLATVRVGSMLVNFTRLLMASVYLLITVLILGGDFNITTSQFYNLLISGFIGLVLGDSFMLKSLEHIGARLAMLLMSLTPPIGAILAFIFLGEVLSVTTIVGIAVTLLGVSIVIMDKDNTNEHKANFWGVFYGVLAAAGQAVGLIFAKKAFNEGPVDEFFAAFIRIAAATFFVYIVGRFAGKLKTPVKTYKNDVKAFKLTVIASILGPYLGITASLIGVAYTKVGIATTLMTTMPIIMLPISRYYYKEVHGAKAIIGAFLAVIGIAILFLV